ncbi:MAG: hypothetical protein VYE31_00645 [Pseudomonadota bacterium]|nr:hypothetical protein [Pseudomonadota bacterium]
MLSKNKTTDLHLLCKDYKFINRSTNEKFTSGYWYFSLERASSLIGANIYFHNTKSELSYTGGIITKVEQQKYNEQDRIVFTFEFNQKNIDKSWQGDTNPRAWYSIVK